MQSVYTATDLREKRMMKALVFYWDEAHWPLAREALRKAGRVDLIGHSPSCLVPPEHGARLFRARGERRPPFTAKRRKGEPKGR
jgi:hypothetical protein